MKRLIGNFKSFEEASKLCTYENELLVKSLQKIYDAKLNDLIEGKDLTVIDFGGDLGSHYYSIYKRGYIKNWIVVETPMKVKAGKETETLKFTTEIPKNADIVLVSGSLQFVPNWRLTLVELLQTGAKLFIFRRMAFGWKEKITLQKSWLSENGGSGGIKDRLIFYPHTTIPKREFMDFIKGVNYIIQ